VIDRKKLVSRLYSSSDKAMKFGFSAMALGAIDSMNVPLGIYNYLGYALPMALNNPINVGYQIALLAADGALAYWSLGEKGWKKLAVIPMISVHAILMDYSSMVIQEKTPFVFPIDPKYYEWRIGAFKDTVFQGLSNWVNEPSTLFPGAIQGYDFLVYGIAIYTGIKAGFKAHDIFKKHDITLKDSFFKTRDYWKGRKSLKLADMKEFVSKTCNYLKYRLKTEPERIADSDMF